MVGDGDFSFSLGLARALLAPQRRAECNGARIGGDTLFVSSYETRETMLRVYPGVERTFEELETLGAVLLFNVDATDLQKTLKTACEAAGRALKGSDSAGSAAAAASLHTLVDSPDNVTTRDAQILPHFASRFSLIVWNFPCIPVNSPNARREAEKAGNAGLDGQSEETAQNQAILRQFGRGAAPLLERGGEVHVVHKTKEPFSWWRVPEQVSADGNGLMLAGRVIFDRSAYPPYRNRKALHRRSFPCHDAESYVFIKALNADVGAVADAPLSRTAQVDVAPPESLPCAVPSAREKRLSKRQRRALKNEHDLRRSEQVGRHDASSKNGKATVSPPLSAELVLYLGEGALSDFGWSEVLERLAPPHTLCGHKDLLRVTPALIRACRLELKKSMLLRQAEVKGRRKGEKKRKHATMRQRIGTEATLGKGRPQTVSRAAARGGKRPRRELSGGERKRMKRKRR
jgi:hypothetical protein